MLKKDKALLESLRKKYGTKHLLKEANEVDTLKAVAQDQANANKGQKN